MASPDLLENKRRKTNKARDSLQIGDFGVFGGRDSITHSRLHVWPFLHDTGIQYTDLRLSAGTGNVWHVRPSATCLRHGHAAIDKRIPVSDAASEVAYEYNSYCDRNTSSCGPTGTGP